LAVNFEEELELMVPPQPIEPLYYGEMRIDLSEGVNKISLPNCDKVEIKVVRLKDGNCKCLVHPLGDTIPVKVNGQRLQADEQVVLSKGDNLEIEKICLRAGKPGMLTRLSHEKSDGSEEAKDSKPRPQKERNFIWFNTAIAFVVLMGATIYLWPPKTVKEQIKGNDQPAELKDTVKRPVIKEEIKNSGKTVDKDEVKGKKKTANLKDVANKPSGGLSSLSDFDLEKKALDGSVDAQYEFGARLIKQRGVNNYIRGIKYLKLAANNGSSRAKTALPKIINSLQQRANDGDSVSYYILKSI